MGTPPNTREALESPLDQGAAEKRTYRIDFTGLGTAAPTSPACRLYDVTDGLPWVDVGSSKLSGAAAASGATVTSQVVSGLEAGRVYRLEVQADDASGGRYVGYVILYGTP